MAAIYQGCIVCGLIQTNNRYFELLSEKYQMSGGSDDAEITDDWYFYIQPCYYQDEENGQTNGDFPKLSPFFLQ